MRKAARTIIPAVLSVGLIAGALYSKPQPPKDYPGSIKSQLALKQKLLKQTGKEGLATALAHVRREWESLTPDQRRQFREQALAFLRKSPQKQEQLLQRYEKLIKMTAKRLHEYRQRANWLAAVTNWLKENEPARLEKLAAMRPAERAKELIALRDSLVRNGKISLEAPTTRPAEKPSPTTRPAAPTTQKATEE